MKKIIKFTIISLISLSFYSCEEIDDLFEDDDEISSYNDYDDYDSNNSTSPQLVGKWVNLNGCQTVTGGQAYFQFYSNNAGRIFNADCASACAGYGYYLNFNWSDNGNSVTLNYTSVSEYCGVQVNTPGPETLSYTISGNQLSIGGATWTK